MAGLLLDTHVVLWWLEDPAQLAANACGLIEDGANDIFVSAAVAWEIAVKSALGKLEAPDDPESALEDAALTPLPISVAHVLGVRGLPAIHQDPFDRIMVAQARIESLTIVTRDPQLRRYPVPTIAA